MIECWHFWGRKTGNSLKAAERPGRETPAAVKESAGPRWLWNGSLLGSGRRSPLSQSWIFRGSRTAALALLIENNPPGTRTHICTVGGGGGRGGECFRNNARHWFWHAWYCNKLIWERNSREMQQNKTAICKQFMTASNHYAGFGGVRSTFTGRVHFFLFLDWKASGCSQFLFRQTGSFISREFLLSQEMIGVNGGGGPHIAAAVSGEELVSPAGQIFTVSNVIPKLFCQLVTVFGIYRVISVILSGGFSH